MVLMILSCLALMAGHAGADTSTIVLQNGLDGYGGCADAFIENLNQTPNGGSAGLKTSCG